jgi:hypothetical protein
MNAMAEAGRGAVRGMRSDEMENSDEARFGESSMPLAEAGGAAVCGGASGARCGEAHGGVRHERNHPEHSAAP